MGKVLSEIGEREASFIAKQKVFFVATAPNSLDHYVSVSPKAQGCIVLNTCTIAYADLTGSGSETAAHVWENGRMTIMFCNLEAGAPKILRVFGQAKVILAENASDSLKNKFPASIIQQVGFRAIYQLQVTRISTSCGYSLPIMKFQRYRNTLNEYMEKLGQEAMVDYRIKKNSFSINGLPSLALMRADAPPIEPFLQDGFVLGKVVSHNNKNSVAMLLKRSFPSTSRTSKSLILRGINLPLALLAVFAAGLATGMFICSWQVQFKRTELHTIDL